MQIRVDVTGVNELASKTENLRNEQLPSALRQAVNNTAAAVVSGLYTEMQSVFDRPTPFTMRSLYRTDARKDSLFAMVGLRDTGSQEIASKYLGPEIFGGDRHVKRFEKALQHKRILPVGMYVMPGAAARLDSYGNVSPGQIVQVLAFFEAFPEMGYSANMTNKTRARLAKDKRSGQKGFAYFALQKVHGKLQPGIYQRYTLGHGSAVKPVMIFTAKPPAYKARLHFYKVGQVVAQNIYPYQVSSAIERAKRAAR